MKITVKTIDGNCDDFDLSEEATVQALKEQIVSKMGIPIEKQRLIFQGKVLKNENRLSADCGIESGKVLHLVLNAPQPPSGSTPTEPLPDSASSSDPMVLNFVDIRTGLPPDLAAITQNIVDSVVSNFSGEQPGFNTSGRPVTVSAMAHSVDAYGNTVRVSSASASTEGSTHHTPPPPSSSSSQPPEAPPTSFEAPPTSYSETTTTSSSTSGGGRVTREAEQRRQEQDEFERERTARQLRNVHIHVKTTRRCLQFATKILDRYERAEAASIQAESAEPMEVSSDATAHPVGGAVGGAREEETMEFEHPPLTDMRPVGDLAYVALLREMEALNERVKPTVQRYLAFSTRRQPLTQVEVLSASRVAITVREFNYYMGHASVAFSRLHLNMANPWPRTISVVPPRRTEMRHLMHQFHSMHPPHPPSSYFIDISRDRNDPETGETITETTSATVNRGTRTSGGGGGSGGGLVTRDGVPLGPIRIEADFNVRRSESDRDRDTTGDVTSSGVGGGEQGGPRTINVDVRRLETGETQIDVRDSASGGQVSSQIYPPSPPGGISLGVGGGGGGSSAGETGHGGEGGEGGEDETPQYLARLVSELITGVPISQQQAATANTSSSSASGATGTTTEGESQKPKTSDGATAKDEGDKQEEDGEGDDPERPRTFAERYAGPEGTTVTIQAAPQPAFGIPGLTPMEGPSISITNPGGGRRPEMNVNFPVPPALQLLQNLLQRATDREHREEGEGEGGTGGQPSQPPPPAVATAANPFLDDDVDSISDAGSMDSINSDHVGPTEMNEMENPIAHLASVAASEMNTGARQSMHTTLSQMREEFGAPEEDESTLGMVELLLQAISKDLSVVELMSVFQGHIGPLQQLQPGLVNFIREKCLNGREPTSDHRCAGIAVETFLAGCIPAVAQVSEQLPLRDQNIDFIQTVYKCLHGIFMKGYHLMIRDYSGCEELAFAHAVHAWGVESSPLFANLLRYCIARDEDFEGAIKLLLSTLFPPSTPSVLLDMCNSSVMKHMQAIKDSSTLDPQEMEKYVVWLNTPSKQASQEKEHPVMVDGTTPREADLKSRDGKPEMRSKPQPPAVVQEEEGRGAIGGRGKQTPVVLTSGSASQSEGGEEKFDEDFLEAMLERRTPKQRESWRSMWEEDAKVMGKMEPQQPFSDGYVSGMPTKKRKVKQLDMSHCQPMTASQLLGRTMTRCLDATGAKPIGKTKEEMLSLLEGHAKLGATLGTEMHYQMGERLAEDTDFDPKRFPNAQKFYNPKKQ